MNEKMLIIMTMIDVKYLLRTLPIPLAASKKNAAEATMVYLGENIGWEKSEIMNGTTIGVINHNRRKHTLSVFNKSIFHRKLLYDINKYLGSSFP